jgi:hypothetical protein
MWIMFEKEGGILGIKTSVMIDTEKLPSNEAAKLKRRIDDANFFNLPSIVSMPPTSAADYYTYTISIEQGGRRHTVQTTDFAPVELHLLIDYFEERARHQHRQD